MKLAPALVVLAALLAGCGKSLPRGTATYGGGGSCAAVTMPATGPRTAPKPTAKLDASKTYDVTISTNCGDFTIRLDPAQSPNAAASFVALSKRGFFDHTVFHRIVPGFIIQGGDPTGTGTSSPGYTTLDKPPADAKYVHGVVAMAKTSVEPAGTAGSQFFVVTAADSGLTPDYAIIGRVVRGLDAVDRIGKLGESNGQPTETVELERATVKIHT
jgi:cyclophilin family peptidyl-prolyl cis-trans isomerase